MRRGNVERYRLLNNEELQDLELETRFRLLDIQAVRQERAGTNNDRRVRDRTTADGRQRETGEEDIENASSTTSEPEIANEVAELGRDATGAPIYRGATVAVLTRTRSRTASFFGVTAAQAIGVDHRGWIRLEATKILRNGNRRIVTSTRKGNNLEIVD